MAGSARPVCLPVWGPAIFHLSPSGMFSFSPASYFQCPSMEEYTDICSLLGLEDIDMKPPALNDKQTIIEETLCDPSDLLDFLVSLLIFVDFACFESLCSLYNQTE